MIKDVTLPCNIWILMIVWVNVPKCTIEENVKRTIVSKNHISKELIIKLIVTAQ